MHKAVEVCLGFVEAILILLTLVSFGGIVGLGKTWGIYCAVCRVSVRAIALSTQALLGSSKQARRMMTGTSRHTVTTRTRMNTCGCTGWLGHQLLLSPSYCLEH